MSSACKNWPKGWLPKDYWTPVRSSIPALIMTGALDHVTPPRNGEIVSRSFSNSRNLVLPFRGHNDVDPCVTGMISTLITAGNAKVADTSCLEKSEQLTFALKEEDLADSE